MEILTNTYLKKIGVTILLSTFVYFHVCCQTSGKNVYLNGKIINAKNEIQVEDMSELKELKLPDSLRLLQIDSTGNISISFKLQKPNYFRIGRNILYLSPGDSLLMNIDYNNSENSTFHGKNAEINEYLKSTPFPKAGSFLEAGDNIRATLKETINLIILKSKSRSIFLDSFKNVSPKIRQLEKARIKADLINSLIYVDFYFPYIHKFSEDSAIQFRKKSKKIIDPYLRYYCKDFINGDFLKIAVYRTVLSEIIKRNTKNTNQFEPVQQWLNATVLFQKIKEINKNEDNSKIKYEIKKIINKDYQSCLLAAFEKVVQFNIGDNAIDFDMVNYDGEVVPISKYKGKTIYIDLWATWCLPCIDELPFLDSLKQNYKNYSNMVFLSLSIDNNYKAWKKFLTEKGRIHETEYRIDRLKLTAYSVEVIPRTIIITKDFKIGMLNGPLPSALETKSILNALIEKN